MGGVVLIFVFLLLISHHFQVKMLYFIQSYKSLCIRVKGSTSNKIKVTNILYIVYTKYIYIYIYIYIYSQSLDKGKQTLTLAGSLRASSQVLRLHFFQNFPFGRSRQNLR